MPGVPGRLFVRLENQETSLSISIRCSWSPGKGKGGKTEDRMHQDSREVKWSGALSDCVSGPSGSAQGSAAFEAAISIQAIESNLTDY